ncbi:HD-like signal output (HDOD) domain, no enzymatic activity [Allochromatium warmingii]|uniref:HD-like signal output (HDOD) domain, no enzymatic activity n=1 Tax=Allochromatium warmingii TaxID=61595 RepID=A0A1H3JCR2_ALLWA|nr:HDOD domain-containing protein [Allochromatium warmingii]SDY36994.1 HD-like signal output (HDOD) domain, no enzymatic activity [Allochromatium warmingii]
MGSTWWNTLIAAARLDEFPVQDNTRRELAQRLVETELPLRRIAEIVLHDPGLALRLLQQANALVEHRFFRREIVTLDDAIHMLGARRLLDIAHAAPVAETVLDTRRLEHYRRCSGRAWLAALLARDWAELARDRVPAEITLAALLNDLGELYLLVHGDARINRYLTMRQHPNVWPHEAEYVTLSLNLEALGYSLAAAWTLPELVRESMRGRNARHSRPLLAMLATQLARHAFGGWRHPTYSNDLALVAELLECDEIVVSERVARVLAQFNARALMYTLQPLAALPHTDSQDPRFSLPLSSAPLFCLAPHADEFKQAATALMNGTITDRDTLIQTWLTGLHRGLGLNRVVYAAFDPERRMLTAEQTLGTDFEPGFNRLRQAVAESELLVALLRAPQVLWLDAHQHAAQWAQLPPAVKTLTGVESCFLRSVWVRGQPLGLLYADRRSPACALDARAYQGLQQLSALAETAWARVESGSRSRNTSGL